MTTTATGPGAPAEALTGDLFDLLGRSRAALIEACSATTTSERYARAQLAALRAAAALLAQVAPRSLGSRPRGAWEALARQRPEFGEWASFFTECGKRSAVAQSGGAGVSVREADDLVRQAQLFLDAVLVHVGLPAADASALRLTPVAVG